MIFESLKECLEVWPGSHCRFCVKICISLAVLLACLPLFLIIHVHALSLLHCGVNLVADFLLGVLLSSVELLGDVDVESSGRYRLFLLPRDQLAVKFLDNVSLDVDELPFDLGIPLDSWLLAFGRHHLLLRSHTTKITPSTTVTVTVTVAAIATATFTARQAHGDGDGTKREV